jgi:hypothetical protein
LEYRTFRNPQPVVNIPRLTLLLQVDGGGHAGEGFRFAVDCARITATIWSRDLFDATDLEGFRLVWDIRGEDVDIRPNSMASKWEDLETLIGKEKVLVYAPDGDEVLNTVFREKLTEAKTSDTSIGASVRWAVQATTRGDMRLILQGLPAGARFLRASPQLSADDSATIHLDSFETETDINRDAPGRGPILVLFARDQDSVSETLSRHQERVWTGKLKTVISTKKKHHLSIKP